MPKMGFRADGDENVYVYLESKSGSAIFGVDAADTNRLKIDASTTAGISPDSSPMAIFDPRIDSTSGAGDITFIPKTQTMGGSGEFIITQGNFVVSALGAGVAQTSTLGVFSSSKGTDGQILISSTAGVPAWAAITAGTGIGVALGANSTTISASSATPLSFPTGSGTATPSANALTIAGGTGITTSGSGSTVTITASGGGSGISTLTGNSGGALSGSNINILTSHSTLSFAGSGTTLTWNGIGDGNNNIGIGSAFASVAGGGGGLNIGLGVLALDAINSGASNIGIGGSAAKLIDDGFSNVAIGGSALSTGVSVNNNVAVGVNALKVCTSDGNVAVGFSALSKSISSIPGNVAVGFNAGNGITTGTSNVFIGTSAGSGYTTGTESSNINIGVVAGTNNTSNNIRIGAGTGTGSGQQNKCFISGIQGITVTGTAILVSSSDQLGIAVSSARYKKDIKDMADASLDLYKLRPVTFVVNRDSAPGLADAPTDRQYGLIAEEVDQIMPVLVNYDSDGKPQGVKYDQLPAILLNEIHRLNARLALLEEKLKG